MLLKRHLRIAKGRHDLPPQRHREHLANCSVRKGFQKYKEGARHPERLHRGWARLVANEPHLWARVHLSLKPLQRRWAGCFAKVRIQAVARGHSKVQDPKLVPGTYSDIFNAQYDLLTADQVPPIIIVLAKNLKVVQEFDISSVYNIFTGAAPLGEETAIDLQAQYPNWIIRQGYGLTETATVVCSSSGHDIWFGSSGSLLPGWEAKLIKPDGSEATGYDEPGELVVRGPSVTLGYLHNEKSTKETFVDGWMRTGDEAVVRKAPKTGNEHIFIVDRLKELIKVKVSTHQLPNGWMHSCSYFFFLVENC